MKGDRTRSELLAAALEGGAVAEEVESLLSASRRLRELLSDLEPDADHLSSLLPRLYADHLRAQRMPRLQLAHPTPSVRDTAPALRGRRGRGDPRE